MSTQNDWESEIDKICCSWEDAYDLGKKELKELVKETITQTQQRTREQVDEFVKTIKTLKTIMTTIGLKKN